MSTMKSPSDTVVPNLDQESLQALRYTHDELASQALERLLQIVGTEETGCGHGKGRTDLYATLREHQSIDPVLAEFWNQTIAVPQWVDWNAIERGQAIFYKHAVANIVGFALQGFIGEKAAAFGLAEVLIRTGGLSTRNLLRRVMETFQWLIEATESLESIQPLGKGHISTIRVRLLHASVRRRLLSPAVTRRGYFDTAKYGTPINTYDSILTITFFCCNPIWVQLPRLGIRLSSQDETDFVALYRYLSYLLGTPGEYFASTDIAKATMEAMLANKSGPTEASRTIANSFIDCLADRGPVFISRGFLEAGSRSMNDDELCDQLGLGKPTLVNYACFSGFCWLVRLVNGIQRLSPAADEWVIRVSTTHPDH